MATILPDASDNRKKVRAPSLLQAAQELVSRGFSVFPCYAILDAGTERARCACRLGEGCASPGKHPIGNTSRGPGTGGVKVATREKAQLRAWWNRWPTLNPAIRTGEDELVVLDVDGEEGYATLRALEEEHGLLPETLTARSGRADGGEHRWFRAPSLAALGSRKIAPGLDLKARDGYVVAPGAVHKTGTRYAWTVDVPVAELPAGWLAWAERAIEERVHRETFERPRFDWTGDPDDKAGRLLARLLHAPEGSRNDTLNEIAFTLGGLWAGNQIEDVRQRVFEAAMSVGLDEREATATLRSGWEAGAKRPLLAKPRMTREESEAVLACFKRPARADAAHRDLLKPDNVLPAEEGSVATAPEEPPAPSEPPVPGNETPEQFEAKLARIAALRKKRLDARPQIPREIACELSSFATRLGARVKELAFKWDDDVRGPRHELAKAIAGICIANGVGTRIPESLVCALDNRVLGDEENPCDYAAEGIEPVTRYAFNTLRRVANEESNYGVLAMNELLGEALGTELAQRSAFWKETCPVEDELEPYERERRAHALDKGRLLELLRAGHEGGVAIPEDMEASLIAGANCSDYVQTHDADCCGVCYHRSVRVCELFWCHKCGPKIRKEEARLARAQWGEIWKDPKERFDVVTFHLPNLTRPQFDEVFGKIRKRLAGFTYEWNPYTQVRAWFASPSRLVYVTPAGGGHQIVSTAIEKGEDAFMGVTKEHDLAGVLSVVQGVRAERAEWIRQLMHTAFQSLWRASKGDEAAGNLAQRAISQIAASGWLRDRHWYGHSKKALAAFPWPSRERRRKALKELAAKERGGAQLLSAKAPERCPAHGGPVPIAIMHAPSRRIVARGLRFHVPLLEAVRLDPMRNANPPARKRRPRQTPEEAAASNAMAAAMVARWKARNAPALE